MAGKREREYLERACKRRIEAVDEYGPDDKHLVILDPSHDLWRGLPTELAYTVLSFLPVDKLVDTLKKVDRKWEKERWLHAFSHNLFGLGKNLVSSYGFVMLRKGKLVALEHESMEWREFPMRPHKELTGSRLIDGSDGLLLCESKKCLITSQPISRRLTTSPFVCGGEDRCSVKLGVWNPLFRAFRWLPAHPKFTECEYSDYCNSHYYVMVDEPSRSYKVFIKYTDSITKTEFYSIYSSKSKTWSDCDRPIPTVVHNSIQYSFSRLTVASGRYVCFGGYFSTVRTDTRSQDYLCCYDAEHGSWYKLSMSKALVDIADSRLLAVRGKFVLSAQIESSAILRDVIYMVVHVFDPNAVGDNNDEWLLASLDLSTLADLSMLAAGDLISPYLQVECFIPGGRRQSQFNIPRNIYIYTYTKQGKWFVAARASDGRPFAHFDVSCKKLLKFGGPYPRLGSDIDAYCCLFRPSFVVP